MSDKNNDGGPAFPDHPLEHPNYWHQGNPGMSLRDWFAGQALAGILSNPGTFGGEDLLPHIGQVVYKFADAMLKAREQQ